MSSAARKRTSPPSSRMPTSNDTRVRVEDLENIMAQHWCRRGCFSCWPRVCFITRASANTEKLSPPVSDSSDNRCFMVPTEKGAEDEAFAGKDKPPFWGGRLRRGNGTLLGNWGYVFSLQHSIGLGAGGRRVIGLKFR